jgi:inositol transport system substrate-binding protein
MVEKFYLSGRARDAGVQRCAAVQRNSGLSSSDDRGPKRSKMAFGRVLALSSGFPSATSGNEPARAVKRKHGRRRRSQRRKCSMKKYLIATAMAALLSNSAFAAKIGVSMDKFDDNFLTVLRNGMSEYAKTQPGVTLQIEDAKDDVSKQLSQVQNFIANKVDAIIVNPVDTSATDAITKAAAEAGVPLVYVNREPADVDKLGPKAAFVASNEKDSGTLETKEICKLLDGKGDILVIEGELSNQAAVQRTKDVHEVIATPDCSGMKVIAEQTASWDRTKAQNLMTNWLSKGMKYDAVISNNDEMAIGALQAMKAAGVDTRKSIVGGVDATQDGLASMKAGDLKVTVFQDAAGQGKGAVDAALKLAKGETVEKKVYIPFQLVTPANMADFMKKN